MLTRAAARADLYRAGLLLALAHVEEARSPLDATDAHYDGPSAAQAAFHNTGTAPMIRAAWPFRT